MRNMTPLFRWLPRYLLRVGSVGDTDFRPHCCPEADDPLLGESTQSYLIRKRYRRTRGGLCPSNGNRMVSPAEMVLGELGIHSQKSEVGPSPHTTYKN